MTTEKVIVNINSSNRIYSIIATLLLCGAVGMAAYALAINGWLEVASTTLTLFLVQLATRLFSAGLITLPAREGREDFAASRGLLRTMYADYQAWQVRSPMWRLALIAAIYTAVFMVARAGIAWSLGVFTNVWIAGAAAALLASIIIAPGLIGTALSHVMKGKKNQGTTQEGNV